MRRIFEVKKRICATYVASSLMREGVKSVVRSDGS